LQGGGPVFGPPLFVWGTPNLVGVGALECVSPGYEMRAH
jgi:hypothetical protein